MNIIVCIKRVPQTAEAEVKVDSTGKAIVRDRLVFDINEPDSYALEEAILLKEKTGGTVTAISVGAPDAEDSLRIALAKGADSAIRISAEEFGDLDGYKTAQLLAAVVKGLAHDIILTGCVATDDNYYQVGPMLAEMLGIGHATLVTKIEVSADRRAQVCRELEGGLLECLDVGLPFAAAVQTGINEPRYASLIAIRRAAAKEIKILGKNELGSVEPGVNSILDLLYPPVSGKRAEIIAGTPDETAAKVAGILKDKGLI